MPMLLARLKSGFLIPKNSMANLAKIEKYLKQKKIKHKISDLGGEIYKVEDVIKVGVNPDEILKTLIVRSTVKVALEFKDKYFALVLRGKDRVDFKEGKDAKTADVEVFSFIREIVDFAGVAQMLEAIKVDIKVAKEQIRELGNL